MMDDYWTHLRGGVNWMRLNKKTIKPKGHATEVFSRWGIDYITEQSKDKTKPFFLYLAYNAPHFPIQPPEDWLKKVQKREPQLELKRATNVAFVEHMDHEIGKVLDAVKRLGIEKDTLITFSSDNGGSIPHAATNDPWRGGKQEHWEGGIRVPTCAVWPGKIPVSQTDELGITMDLLPTFAEIVGAKVENEIEGQSSAPIWLKRKKRRPQPYADLGTPGRKLPLSRTSVLRDTGGRLEAPPKPSLRTDATGQFKGGPQRAESKTGDSSNRPKTKPKIDAPPAKVWRNALAEVIGN
jgi:arylsulfatase A-like enzyme